MTGHRRPLPLDPIQHGAYDYDEAMVRAERHIKVPRRKPYAIESRIVPTSKDSITHTFGLDQWFIHGRYETETARDQAFTVLTSKAERELRGWSRTEWRKVG